MSNTEDTQGGPKQADKSKRQHHDSRAEKNANQTVETSEWISFATFLHKYSAMRVVTVPKDLPIPKQVQLDAYRASLLMAITSKDLRTASPVVNSILNLLSNPPFIDLLRSRSARRGRRSPTLAGPLEFLSAARRALKDPVVISIWTQSINRHIQALGLSIGQTTSSFVPATIPKKTGRRNIPLPPRFSRNESFHEYLRRQRLAARASIRGQKPSQLLNQSISLADNATSDRNVVKFVFSGDELQANHLSALTSALVALHTKYVLIATARFGDLVTYSLTHDQSFEIISPLQVGKLSHNSPGEMEIKIDLTPTGVSEAFEKTVDTVLGAGQRKRERELSLEEKAQAIDHNEARLEAELAQKELERQIAEQSAKLNAETLRSQLEQATADQEQKRQLERERAEIDADKQRLELEKQKLELERDKIQFGVERLRAFQDQVKLAEQIARENVLHLRPDLSPDAQALLIAHLIPELLRLNGITGWNVVGNRVLGTGMSKPLRQNTPLPVLDQSIGDDELDDDELDDDELDDDEL